jgi:hypothetical protein
MTPGERSAESFRRLEQWRAHPLLSSSLRSAVPGFGLGLAAFVVYCVGEKALQVAGGGKKGAHGDGHH